MTSFGNKVKNLKILHSIRYYSVKNTIQRQNELFDSEKAKQISQVGRIEKIKVKYEDMSGSRSFLMNKNLSTPYNVANHLSEWLSKESALAIVNDETIWDMHRPLEDNCILKFLRFNDEDPFQLNKAFWKFCSYMLGATISVAFAENIQVTLHSFPSPQITSGSFIYDAGLSLNNWTPSSSELRVLSSEMVKLANRELPLERLQVDENVAKEIFIENKFKLAQIPSIAKSAGGKITLYRMGTHIDISKGPLLGNSTHIGRCSITAVHRIKSDDGPLYRFQGVALPKEVMVNHFAFKILEDRAMKPNLTSFNEATIMEAT